MAALATDQRIFISRPGVSQKPSPQRLLSRGAAAYCAITPA
ncbi:MAG TPA: hypothetical protein VKR55_06060 [Bradyrhizobium sp.]|nr:hypothetical protein [Bradyrhizobium sp.]HLZ01704.1 hypothetical protein [Bradyrhizobium sp.]